MTEKEILEHADQLVEEYTQKNVSVIDSAENFMRRKIRAVMWLGFNIGLLVPRMLCQYPGLGISFLLVALPLSFVFFEASWVFLIISSWIFCSTIIGWLCKIVIYYIDGQTSKNLNEKSDKIWKDRDERLFCAIAIVAISFVVIMVSQETIKKEKAIEMIVGSKHVDTKAPVVAVERKYATPDLEEKEYLKQHYINMRGVREVRGIQERRGEIGSVVVERDVYGK